MSERPIAIDFCCGPGGASMGYYRAGFDVIGVDVNPQPHYPFPLYEGDALELLPKLVEFYRPALVAGSPPCQEYTALKALHGKVKYPDIIAPMRAAFEGTGLPYIIENVMPAPLIKDLSIVLCGCMFPNPVTGEGQHRTYRKRRFESNVPLTAPPHRPHLARTATSRRRERWAEGWNVSITGDPGRYVGPEAMGIDWMTGNELSEAIPPAYTEYLGAQLLAHIRTEVAA